MVNLITYFFYLFKPFNAQRIIKYTNKQSISIQKGALIMNALNSKTNKSV